MLSKVVRRLMNDTLSSRCSAGGLLGVQRVAESNASFQSESTVVGPDIIVLLPLVVRIAPETGETARWNVFCRFKSEVLTIDS